MKSYKADSDGIVVLDRRQLTKGTIVPNFIIDIYLPILKYPGLGLLTTIYRLTTEESSWNKLRDYMKAGGMGYEKLNELLELFEELGFMKVEKPQGLGRIKHMRTTITLLDPPARIPEQYRDLVVNATIAKWLFEVEPIKQDSFHVEEVEEEEPQPKEKAAKVPSPVNIVKNEFLKLLPESQLATVNHPREAKWAKNFVTFAERMGWDIDFLNSAIIIYYHEMKRQSYWSDKSIWLQNLYRDFGAWVDANNIKQDAAGDAQDGSGEAQDLGWHPDWRGMDENHPEFWVVGTKLPFEDGTMECKMIDGWKCYVNDAGNIVFAQG